jgi:hypothetical protein
MRHAENRIFLFVVACAAGATISGALGGQIYRWAFYVWVWCTVMWANTWRLAEREIRIRNRGRK